MCGLLVSSSETVVLTHLNTWEEKVVSTWWDSCSWGKCSAEDRPAKHCSGRRDMLSSLGSSKQLKSWIIRERQVSFLSVQPLKQMSKGKEEKRKLYRVGGGLQQHRRAELDTPLFFSHPSSLNPLFSSGELCRLWPPPSLPLFLSGSVQCRLLPIPVQSINLSKFLLDPIRAYVSKSETGKLL